MVRPAAGCHQVLPCPACPEGPAGPMIGVLANPSEERALREFFELFKTPWEFCQPGCPYEVVLCTTEDRLDAAAAKLLLMYSSRITAFDDEQHIQIRSQLQGAALSWAGDRLPIYGNSITFRHQGTSVLIEESSGECVAFMERRGDKVFARVGYDLFRQVQTLLSKGQPPANAGVPTLELHIGLLRNLIVASGLALVEIPPVPEGHAFTACLTHDVAHPCLRRHKFDRTMFGFLYRAIFGSIVNVGRGRLSLRRLFTNWTAAAKLPFVYLGLAEDFWY